MKKTQGTIFPVGILLLAMREEEIAWHLGGYICVHTCDGQTSQSFGSNEHLIYSPFLLLKMATISSNNFLGERQSKKFEKLVNLKLSFGEAPVGM